MLQAEKIFVNPPLTAQNLINMEIKDSTLMEIKDNTFLRQFETHLNEELISVEYSFQDRKIFLTKIHTPDNFENEEFINTLLAEIMAIAYERKLKVVPVLPKIAKFFKKNTTYRDLLPPGIRI